MQHVVTNGTARHRILRGIREFFWARGFLEVETPTLLAYPSQEPYLEPLRTTLRDNRGQPYDAFLRMSPEFSLKKLVASMRGNSLGVDGSTGGGEGRVRGIFEIGPVFRDGEPWGGTHNPEFTMLEWYRVHADYRQLMRDCEALITALVPRRRWRTFMYRGQRIELTPPWERLTMRQAWERYAGLDLDRLRTRAAMAHACALKGYTVARDDTYDDCFFKIHLTEVEPKLGVHRPTFLLDWPAPMAALARRKSRNPWYAERVECSVGGLELANGFSELTDADEQLTRFRVDQRLRRKLGKPVYPIDQDFIAALRRMPRTAGIALGVDRLVMLLTDAASIDEVRLLPAHDLFRT